MEHIFFEVQLCIKISIFKEKHVFDILIILPSLGSLYIMVGFWPGHRRRRYKPSGKSPRSSPLRKWIRKNGARAWLKDWKAEW